MAGRKRIHVVPSRKMFCQCCLKLSASWLPNGHGQQCKSELCLQWSEPVVWTVNEQDSHKQLKPRWICRESCLPKLSTQRWLEFSTGERYGFEKVTKCFSSLSDSDFGFIGCFPMIARFADFETASLDRQKRPREWGWQQLLVSDAIAVWDGVNISTKPCTCLQGGQPWNGLLDAAASSMLHPGVFGLFKRGQPTPWSPQDDTEKSILVDSWQ